MKYAQRFVLLAVAISAIGLSGAFQEDWTISKIMKEAHKPADSHLLRKVAQGKASDTEKKKLLNLYEALAAEQPPKGELNDWKQRTALLVEAAQAAVDGSPEASNMLIKASNCTSCHKAHR